MWYLLNLKYFDNFCTQKHHWSRSILPQSLVHEIKTDILYLQHRTHIHSTNWIRRTMMRPIVHQSTSKLKVLRKRFCDGIATQQSAAAIERKQIKTHTNGWSNREIEGISFSQVFPQSRHQSQDKLNSIKTSATQTTFPSIYHSCTLQSKMQFCTET